MTSITTEAARFVAGLRHDDIPEAVRKRARMVILDHVGIALRARHEATLVPAMERGLRTLGLASGETSVIGDRQGYTPAAAALFNGNLGHALDFDDTHAPGSIHSGAPIIPAALAAAQMSAADGAAVVAGVVAGFEVQIRLSLALVPSEHYRRGFHPTATCGVFGAAAAASVVLGLDAEQVASAFGLCGSQAAGSMQFLVDGAWNKPYHTGFAASNGLTAACMAREGFRGATQAFEGDRYGHAAMDAIIALRAANDIDWQDVEAVEVGLPRTGMTIIGEPAEEKRNPGNYVDGQFSMPFVAAVALRDGCMDWDSYARHLDDADTLALCRKVSSVCDDEVESHYPANMSGVARIRTSTGRFEQLVVVPRGEPENFMSDDELRAKFNGLVSPYLSEQRREQLADALLGLSAQADVSRVLHLARPDLAAPVAEAGDD
jgi:2-methylcitrate dehydratase PrpD